MTDQVSERWTRRSGGHVVYSDTEDHAALVMRTLAIDEATWTTTLDRYAERVQPGARVGERLAALAEAFARATDRTTTVPDAGARRCSVCDVGQVTAFLARRATAEPFVYGRCDACGHAPLVSGAASTRVYEHDTYFEQRDDDGVGYESYGAEQRYREAKAARLLGWIERAAALDPNRPSLLEVGSGFGFTRRAASERGWITQGVDVSPAAARWANRLYGLDTVTSRLGDALDRGLVEPHAWDLVLYQFVLEHIEDPVVELRRAVQAARPGGLVAFVVPSASAFEIEVFGACYRSVRRDHLHLFSVASARACAAAAGLTEVAHESTCSVHLLRGFLEPGELDELYRNDQGPDLTFLGRSPCDFPSS